MKGIFLTKRVVYGPIAVVLLLLTSGSIRAQVDVKYVKGDTLRFFPADNRTIQYIGRIDFTDRKKPRFWAPGTYINIKFLGPSCEVGIHDEMPDDKTHNILSFVVDDGEPFTVKLKNKKDMIKVAQGLTDGPHTLTICKNTEAGVGYIEFTGIKCKGLQPVLPPTSLRRIEFIGNSITCGSGSDLSVVPCDKGQWFDQTNAYKSYGPTVARALKAQWTLAAVSGIGLIHSCCNMNITMPKVYGNLNQRKGTGTWDFKRFQPDLVVICLGENDGIQDSLKFCGAYVKFIEDVKGHYPKARIVCLSSPMADNTFMPILKNYLTGIVNYFAQQEDKGVYKYFFSQRYMGGCGEHPTLAEHQLMAKELTAYIAETMGWN